MERLQAVQYWMISTSLFQGPLPFCYAFILVSQVSLDLGYPLKSTAVCDLHYTQNTVAELAKKPCFSVFYIICTLRL